MERSVDEAHPDDHPLFGGDDSAVGDRHVPGSRSRSQRHRRKRRRRRRIAPLIAIAVIIAVVGVGFVLVRSLGNRLAVADFSGTPGALTKVRVASGDGAEDVAVAMQEAGVVKSSRAFVDAAKKSGQADDIQPGVYQVRLRSSGQAAMAAILDPANRLVTKVTIPEGNTERQILATLASKTGLPAAQFNAAATELNSLGIPDGYTAKTAEGFLFPDTYQFDDGTTPLAMLQDMVTRFSGRVAQLNFAAKAKALSLTPSQVLIVASLIESEAKFPEDRPKIARVIYNRLASGVPIGIDASNRYGLAVQGKDPNSVTYQENSPYNVRINLGLPPTPVSNPGAASLQAAISPAVGNWTHYVVADAQGHHIFTSTEAEFAAAEQRCVDNGWC
ncbi:MAG: endolytic transglycosylase MltG [Frankiales bacterium]|nr:endolytic transglycosylase MltG [Frankiales bacterium]